MFQERTLFDLLVEYYVDAFEKKPIEAQRNEQGEIQFTDTGDALIDKWEEQIARGETPDLFEAFDEESIQHIERVRQAQRDRDPYQGVTIKDTADKMSRILQGEKPRGFRDLSPEQQKMLAQVLASPTFGTDEL